MPKGYTYIMTNKNNTVLYVGVTSELRERVDKHKEKKYPNSFTARYNIDKLVYFEKFENMGDAIQREKQLKAGSRKKKEALINSVNSGYKDLHDKLPG